MIKVTSLSKKYKKEYAVKEISFQLNLGESVGLVGPNGAGKTTTIKTIVGLLKKNNGNIDILGHDHSTIEAKRYLGYLPEEPMLYDYMTVEEHLQFVALAYEIRDWKGKADYLLERFNLSDSRKKLSKELSKGMKQKVSICVTFMPDYSFFLLDEPFIGLDPSAIFELKKIIVETRQAGKGLLISSHMLSLIEELTERIIVMNNGRIIFEGNLESLKAESSKKNYLEEVFLDIVDENK